MPDGGPAATRAFDTLRRGLPTRKVEAWHYTDLRRLLSSVPCPDPAGTGAAPSPCSKDSSVLSVANGKAAPFATSRA
jgi:Fe-S cluster assembly protein SufD